MKTMNRTKMMAAVAAAIFGIASVASAQPRDDRGRGGERDGHGPDRGQMERGRPGAGPGFRPGPDRGPGFGPEHSFHRGDRLPNDYRGRQYVIDDWRGHRLQAPPRGYHWVQIGADFALVAITTGIIAQLLSQ